MHITKEMLLSAGAKNDIVCVYTCMYVCVHIYTCVYIHTFVYIHVHVYTYFAAVAVV